jgi:hypothetical protein
MRMREAFAAEAALSEAYSCLAEARADVMASTGTRRFFPKCGIRAARRLAQADFRKRHG